MPNIDRGKPAAGQVQTWRGIPTPHVASWASGTASRREICVVDGAPVLVWSSDDTPGVGEPSFRHINETRQREVAFEDACQICLRRLSGRTRVCLVVNLEDPSLEPLPQQLICRECGPIALRFCPVLRRAANEGRLRVLQVEEYVLLPIEHERDGQIAVAQFIPGPKKWIERDVGWLQDPSNVRRAEQKLRRATKIAVRGPGT